MKLLASKEPHGPLSRRICGGALVLGLSVFCSACIDGRKARPDGGVLVDAPAPDRAWSPDVSVSDDAMPPPDGIGPPPDGSEPDALPDEGLDTGGSCSGNADCGPYEFCNLDGHCGLGGMLGICETRPTTACSELYGPVCGCDVVEYGNSCKAHFAGASVLHDGECDPQIPNACYTLELWYGPLLDQAKACLDGNTTYFLCEVQVQDALVCPCPTYVSDAYPDALVGMQDLKDQWDTAGCNLVDRTCPVCPPPPSGAECVDGSGKADCVDR